MTRPFVTLWSYEVPPDARGAFERAYGPDGDWAQLFRRAADYIGTELLHDPAAPTRFMTIDRWRTREAYEAFKAEWAQEYRILDERCDALTTSESHVGSFDGVAGLR